MTAMTKWFDPSIKPVRPGWYDSSVSETHRFPQVAYWTGSSWTWHEEQRYECVEQQRYWRGLKAPAK
jgi:hypothetical protein